MRPDLEPYVVPALGGAANVGAIIYPRTAAETLANVDPSRRSFSEGDIRRYGAAVSATDNSAEIAAALAVSGAGGSATYIPPGTWNCSRPVTVARLSSMYGAGNASVLSFSSCDGLVFALGTSSYASSGLSRFFRDFQIFGAGTASEGCRAIYINFPQSNPTAVIGIDFHNLNLKGFRYGVCARGLWYSVFQNCSTFSCYYGFYFAGNNIACTLSACYACGQELKSINGSVGITIDTVSGETTEAFKIIACETYYFDVGIDAPLSYDLKIEACNLAACQTTGIALSATIEGFVVRDCWIDLNCLAGAKLVRGISISNVQPTGYAKIIIEGNTILNERPFAASTGISVGNASHGIVINSNHLIGFDQGISIAYSRATVKWNTINCVTTAHSASTCAIGLDSAARDCEIGPNDILAGSPVSGAMSTGSAAITVPSAAAFPVGLPVQFDVTANGFTAGITYYVVSSSGTSITVGASGGAAALAATGNSPLNVFAQPEPVRFKRTPAGLLLYAAGASHVSAGDAAMPAIARWAANGRQVSLAITVSGGKLSDTSFGIADLPNFLFPVVQQGFMVSMEDESSVSLGHGVATSTAECRISRLAATAGPSGSGSRGLLKINMTWPYL